MDDFQVVVKNGVINVRVARGSREPHYLRLDMSDGSVAFLRLVSQHPRTFSLEERLLSASLEEHLEERLRNDVRELLKKHSSERADILVHNIYATGFTIGRPLSATFDITATQAGVVHGTKRRVTSAPITIAHASAATRAEAQREIEQRNR